MNISDTYLTISAPAEGLYKDRGSKFMAFAYPVKTEREVKQHISMLKKEHFSARHWCYAYLMGAEKEYSRAIDDGEPSGTAGKPILGQIQSKSLTNIAIVVVRYFGGTLLGTNGLINAYREAAANAIDNANIITEIVTALYEVKFNYLQMNSVMKLCKDQDLKIIKQDLNEECSILIEMRKGLITEVLSKLEKIAVLNVIPL